MAQNKYKTVRAFKIKRCFRIFNKSAIPVHELIELVHTSSSDRSITRRNDEACWSIAANRHISYKRFSPHCPKSSLHFYRPNPNTKHSQRASRSGICRPPRSATGSSYEQSNTLVRRQLIMSSVELSMRSCK